MSAPPSPKIAVYYGTITLNDGTPATYTAAQVAGFYGVSARDYLAVSLTGPEPFANGQEYMNYIHLKPLADSAYYDAVEQYNLDNAIQYGEDFMIGQGKWAKRPNEGWDQDTF